MEARINKNMENQGIELRGKLKRAEHEREVLLNCLRTIRAVAVDCDIRQLAEEGVNYLAHGKDTNEK